MSELPNQSENPGDDLVFAEEEFNEQGYWAQGHMEDYHCRR